MAHSHSDSDHTVWDETRTTAAKDDLETDSDENLPEAAEPPTDSQPVEKHVDTDVEKGAPAQDPPVAPVDPNIVNWDGPDDPANPRNWSKSYKLVNVTLVSLSVLYVNLATTMFAPGASIMQREFGYKSSTVEILTVTIASLGFAIGQLFVSPLSEVFGRMPIYRVSAIFYLGFTAGCARSTNVAEFLVFRLCTGLSASSYMSTGGGTVADLLEKQERGVAMAIFTAGPLFGPVLGPIIGGFVTENLSWRWTFYLIMMLAGAVSVASFLIMRETSAVAILKAKTKRLMKETGNPNLRAAGDRQIPIQVLVRHALVRPIKFLYQSPVVFLISLYIAFNFGVTMLLLATFPSIYENTYHWSVGISGLAYIGVGVGCAIGVFIFAKFSDRLVKPNAGGTYRPERRLILMMFVSPLFPIGLFIYGWTAKYRTPWIAPIIGTAVCGPGAVVISSSAQTYMIDVFGPQTAASALSAITLLRNLTGAFLPLAAPSLYDHLGLGWGNSVLAFITIGFIPIPFLFYRYGEWLRTKFPVNL
ncbi:MFS transporter [Aspergillus ibericus CBS 121593]|uniref:MFS general substrate transporter n=1 Tax=Aspergillus ibericus CBS 121593 TaxID=1448316 RepID=A0A395GJA6_9EURO|nr:MFS general substrate transporter [Aspergillus ibericus CBS 121593]RAK95570.1 MFS general substrate transporter [Aspergillus ibericus CBS 121593]